MKQAQDLEPLPFLSIYMAPKKLLQELAEAFSLDFESSTYQHLVHAVDAGLSSICKEQLLNLYGAALCLRQANRDVCVYMGIANRFRNSIMESLDESLDTGEARNLDEIASHWMVDPRAFTLSPSVQSFLEQSQIRLNSSDENINLTETQAEFLLEDFGRPVGLRLKDPRAA